MSSDVRSLDVIGDVHGSLDQLHALLTKLGYQESGGRWSSPSERRLVFLGDYIDRGRKPYETYRLVRGLCEQGIALGAQRLGRQVFSDTRHRLRNHIIEAIMNKPAAFINQRSARP